MNEFRHDRIENLPEKHRVGTENYEYCKRDFVPRGAAQQTMVSFYQIPPGKSAYPYHFHHKNEETFYILRGEGILKTPEGERTVRAGDLLFFPAHAAGAHKLTNCSETEAIEYLEFDVVYDVDVTEYPDSDKIGIWGKGGNRIYRREDAVDYYEGE